MNTLPRWSKKSSVTLLACSLGVCAGAVGAQPATPAGQASVAPAASIDIRVWPQGADQSKLAPVRAALSKLGTPKSIEDVQAWSDQLTQIVRQSGYPIAQVLMTQDDWQRASQTNAWVFSVYLGNIERVMLENHSRVKDDRLQRLIEKALCGKAQVGASACALETKRLERATQLLQDVPGVRLGKAPEFAPGSGTGGIVVKFFVDERGKPSAFGAVLDNNGYSATGTTRLGGSFSGNNVLGMGEEYSVSLLTTDKGAWTGELAGSMPLGDNGTRLTGGLSRQQYGINISGTPLAGAATTAQVGVQYPWARGLDKNIWGGASLLRSRTETKFKAFDFGTQSDITAARFYLQANNGDRAQQLRTSTWAAQGAVTIGHQSNNDPQDVVTQRAGNYVKLTGAVQGRWMLGPAGDTFVTAGANAQWANRNLDPSEKMLAGGPSAVRAYRADEPSFDQGLMASVGVYKQFPIAAGHQLQVGTFVDAARGQINRKPWANWESSYIGVPDVTNMRTLAGYGVGVSWLTPIGATVSATVAKPFSFSSPSWVDPGKRPVQTWLTLSWDL